MHKLSISIRSALAYAYAYAFFDIKRIKLRFRPSCAIFAACFVEPSRNRFFAKILILLISLAVDHFNTMKGFFGMFFL